MQTGTFSNLLTPQAHSRRFTDEAKVRGFPSGPWANSTPYQRPDVWQQPDPFTPSTARHKGAVHVSHCFGEYLRADSKQLVESVVWKAGIKANAEKP